MNVRLLKLDLIFLFLMLLFYLIPVTCTAQEFLQEEAVKSNMIFRLSEYFSWPKENNLHKIVIAIFEDETHLFPFLSTLAQSRKIKGKPVEIKRIKGPGDLQSVQIFYIDPERSLNAIRYYENIKGKNILFFTDQCETTDESMINLIVTKENKLSFEISRKNLESNRFSVPTELLVLGGSQLEIKAAFDETQKNLRAIQDKVKQQQNEIENQKKVISDQSKQVETQKQTINRQNDEINNQQNIYRKLKTSIDSTYKVLETENTKLEEQRKNIEMRDGLIKDQESKINEQLSILSKQVAEIDEGKQKIENQMDALNKQTTQIDTQKTIIFLSSLFLVVFVILSVLIFRSNNMNKRINKQLIINNAQIEKQKLDLEYQKKQLEISNNELESFSYSVSHDLRAPLRIIDGYSNIVLNEYGDKLDKQASDFLTKIIGSSKKMAALIDDLLKLAKITRQPLIKETFNLSAAAASIIDELKSANAERNITITLKENILAQGDPRLLVIVLQNLLDNAFKFTSKTENPVIEIGSYPEENKTVYYVKDNGAGFDMENSDKLFHAFQRLHDNGEFPGSGIGLSIVQRIIKRHGGNIRMEARPGNGACVYFTLS